MMRKRSKIANRKIKIDYTDRYKTALDISETIKDIKKIIFLSSFFYTYSINKAFFKKDKIKDNGDIQLNFNGGFFQKG